MKRLLAFLRFIFLSCAWLLFLSAIGLFLLEETGFLTAVIRDRVARELGPLGARLQIEQVRLHWFEPGLTLEGITFDGENRDGTWVEGKERLRVSEVHVLLDPSLDPTRPVESISVRGGRMILSDTLVQALEALLGEMEDTESTARRPPISVSGIEVDLETPTGSEIAIGSTDFVLEDDEGGPFNLRGRLWPTLGGAAIAPVAINIHGETWLERGVHLHASARSLALDSAGMTAVELLAPTGLESFRGELTLDADARFHPDVGKPPSAALRVALRDAHLTPRAQVPIEKGTLDLKVRFEPAPGMELWDTKAWAATVRAEGEWNRSPVEAWALLGADASSDTLVEAWASVEDLQLDEDTLRAFQRHDDEDTMRDFRALAPRGVVDTHVVYRLPRGAGESSPVSGESLATARHELVVDLVCDGGAEMTFHGWRDARGNVQGCPVPCDGVSGLVIFTRNDALSRPEHLAFVGMQANHGSGIVYGEGLFSSPLEGRSADMDFRIRVPSMAVGPVLAEGLQGMDATKDVWATYNPVGGEISAEWRLRARQDLGGLSGWARIGVHEVGMTWSDVPVPLERVDGELEIRWARNSTELTGTFLPEKDRPDSRRPIGVRWTMESRPEQGQKARVFGIVREESLPREIAPEAVPSVPLQEIRVELEELLLRGEDWNTLAARFPEMGAQVTELKAQGSVDATFVGARHHPAAAYRYDVEATPRQVVVTPRFFQRQTQDLRGRILIHGVESLDAEEAEIGDVSTHLGLFGRWGSDVLLAAEGRVPAREPAQIRVYGAGVDPSNPTLKAVLFSDGTQFSEFELDGRLDFDATVDLAPGDEEPQTTYRVFLRENGLRTEALRLDRMRGVLVQRDDVLQSPLIEASLAGTPIELRNAFFLSTAAARNLDQADPMLRSGELGSEEGFALQADWSTERMSLDREHLEPFVDAETIDLLLNETGLTGEVDVDAARILVVSDPDGKSRVAFHGRAEPRRVRLTAGVPIAIRRAAIDVESLVLEAGRVRAWWSVSDLDAQVAGRRIDDASMIVTFIDGRLSIDNLDGDFESGVIRGLGGVELANNALAVDLTKPYGFTIAVRLDDVPVERLLGGLFEASAEDYGKLSTTLRLHGRGDDVLALAGSGGITLDDTRVWSVPVMRELFTNLGFDRTASFDRMQTRWQLEDGTIRLTDIRVRSPLLNLVGEGAVDLDGTVYADLEVRYSLVDRLGGINRIIYWLNNSLWRVAVRGDLARPRVLVRNSVKEALFGFDEDFPRRLPLPGWSPLSSDF